MAKRKVAQLASVMLLAAYSTLSYAQSNVLHQSAMSWPMQQGESLDDVARLFYPQNPYMQRQFVAAAIQLNQDSQPSLKAKQVFSEQSLIVIPDIKVLSKKSLRQVASSRLTQTKQTIPKQTKVQRINAVADSAIGDRLQSDYANLMQRNALFKHELETLNVRLLALQQRLVMLKEDLMRLISVSTPSPTPVTTTLSTQVEVLEPSVAHVPTHKAIEDLSLSMSGEVQPIRVTKNTDTFIATRDRLSEIYLWMPLSVVLVVFILLIALVTYTRKQAEKLKSVVASVAVQTNVHTFFESVLSIFPSQTIKAKSATLSSEFSGSISDAETLAKVMDEKEDAELMLEQAKIYVNLGRHEDAIKLLSAHIHVAPKNALQHWLYLLDIYRDTNQEQAFKESAEQLHHTFNVVMPEWEKSTTVKVLSAPSHSLETYDYIVNKVTTLWAECEKEAEKMMQTKHYLDQLLTDTRNHERTGFSMEVFEEIVMLRDMLDAREKLAQEVY
jgi:tetratricopeptide (TPR) repeat protein